MVDFACLRLHVIITIAMCTSQSPIQRTRGPVRSLPTTVPRPIGVGPSTPSALSPIPGSPSGERSHTRVRPSSSPYRFSPAPRSPSPDDGLDMGTAHSRPSSGSPIARASRRGTVASSRRVSSPTLPDMAAKEFVLAYEDPMSHGLVMPIRTLLG